MQSSALHSDSLGPFFHAFLMLKFVAGICLTLYLPIFNSCVMILMPMMMISSDMCSPLSHFQAAIYVILSFTYPLSSENFFMHSRKLLIGYPLHVLHIRNWKFCWVKFCEKFDVHPLLNTFIKSFVKNTDTTSL